MAPQRRSFVVKTATLQLRLSNRPPRNVGVFLLDVVHDRLHWRLISNWDDYADEDDIEVLQSLDASFQVQVHEMGGTKLLAHIAETWSNTLQLGDERVVEVGDCQAEIVTLFRDRVAQE